MKKNIRVISIFLVLLGILLLISNHIITYKKEANEKEKVEQFLNISNKVKPHKLINKKQLTNDYIAILEIPKIKLKQGLVSPNSKENNVNKHVTILGSYMPSDNFFILAAHSGNSKVSYFKKLNQLTKGDNIYIYYNDTKYKYKVIKHYQKKKNGKLDIGSSFKDKILVLTTCKPISFNKQLVYIAKLDKTLKY